MWRTLLTFSCERLGPWILCARYNSHINLFDYLTDCKLVSPSHLAVYSSVGDKHQFSLDLTTDMQGDADGNIHANT
jgi:hypothetical protein